MSKMASSPFGVEIERGLGTQREGTGIVLAATRMGPSISWLTELFACAHRAGRDPETT